MDAKRVIIPYAPRKQFLEYHQRSERFAAIVAHRRAGKTVACVNEEIRAALICRQPNARTAYIAPYYKQAKAVAWTYAKHYALRVPGAVANESELRIDFPTGGQFRLYGADNPDALRGIYLDSVTLDENADMNPRLFPEVIRPTLVDRRGKATFIGTPKGRNDFFKTCEYAKSHPDWFFLELRASKTGIIPQDELSALRSAMSEEQYEQEFECSFTAAILGAIYGKEFMRVDRDGRITNVSYDEAVPVCTAWDLGHTDDTTIWFYQVVGGEVHVIDFYFASGENIDHYGQVVKSKPYKYADHYLPHDAKARTLASGGKSIQEQLAAHLGWENLRIVPRLSVEDGIQAARKMFDRVYFDYKCEEGIEALRQYQREWDDDKKTFRKKPRHDWTSHAADAFRYLAIAWQEEAAVEKQHKEPRDPYGFHEEVESWRI